VAEDWNLPWIASWWGTFKSMSRMIRTPRLGRCNLNARSQSKRKLQQQHPFFGGIWVTAQNIAGHNNHSVAETRGDLSGGEWLDSKFTQADCYSASCFKCHLLALLFDTKLEVKYLLTVYWINLPAVVLQIKIKIARPQPVMSPKHCTVTMAKPPQVN
jgi:hypothetical protein